MTIFNSFLYVYPHYMLVFFPRENSSDLHPKTDGLNEPTNRLPDGVGWSGRSNRRARSPGPGEPNNGEIMVKW